MNRFLKIFVVVNLFLLSGCGLEGMYINENYIPELTNAPEQERIMHRILLIGDAGEPAIDFREPVLNAVEIQASVIPARTTILFLGDNIYPYGLDDPDTELRIISESRLKEQVKVAENSGAEGIFIPGNHDWDQGGKQGWIKIVRQADYIDSLGDAKITMLPKGGCPGPVVRDYGNSLRIIILDTQWWLHVYEKPSTESNNCDNISEEEILKSLDDALKTADDRFVIVAAHHPLNTYGTHGGYFHWTDHIFPLRNIHPDLWIPLPVIGSIYPFARLMGISNQDLSSSEYQHMISKFESVLSKYSNWTFAAGHEHSVQVLKGVNNQFYLVSGFGTSIHNSNVDKGDSTVFADVDQGFIQVDLLRNKEARMSVFKVDEDSENWVEVFSMVLNN